MYTISAKISTHIQKLRLFPYDTKEHISNHGDGRRETKFCSNQISHF